MYLTLFLYCRSDFTEAKLVQTRDLLRSQTVIISSNRVSMCRMIKFDRLCKLINYISNTCSNIREGRIFTQGCLS